MSVAAVANELHLKRLRVYLRDEANASEGALTEASVKQGAAELLLPAGLEPEAFGIFSAQRRH